MSTLDVNNILQENLSIILYSVDMISLSRLMSILHLSINVPMQWISGKLHTLSAHDWSIKSIGRAGDCLYDAMLELEKDGWNILDEQFIFNIFKPLKLKTLDEYAKYIFYFKKTPTVSNTGKKSWEIKSKSNFSTQPANRIKQRHRLWSN